MNQDINKSLFQSLSAVGPMLNVIGLFSIIAGIVNNYLLYAVIFSFIIAIFNIYLPFKSSKELRSNGGYYTIAGVYGGKKSGFYVSMIYVIYGFASFPSITLFNYSLIYYVTSDLFSSILIAAIISFLEILLINKGNNDTLKLLKFLSLIEVIFLLILDSFMLSQGKFGLPKIQTIKFLNYSFWTGIMFSLLIFAGLGSPLFISENLDKSKENIYKGISIAYFLSGISMIFTAISIEMFLGKNIFFYSDNPFYILNILYKKLGIYIYVITITISIVSATNLSLSYLNAWRNSIKRMSADGILPNFNTAKLMYALFFLNLLILISLAIKGFGFIGFVFFAGLVSLAYLSTHTISNFIFLRNLLTKKNLIGISILIISSVIMTITIILTLSHYVNNFQIIPLSYLIMLIFPLFLLIVKLNDNSFKKITIHYE